DAVQPFEQGPEILIWRRIVRKDLVELLEENVTEHSPAGLAHPPVVEESRERTHDLGPHCDDAIRSGLNVCGVKDQRVIQTTLLRVELQAKRLDLRKQAIDDLRLLAVAEAHRTSDEPGRDRYCGIVFEE